MPKSRLPRVAAWCALAGGVAIPVAIVFFIVAPTVAVVVEVAMLLTLGVVFYALYVAHRSGRPGLSLAGVVLGILAVALDLVSMANYGNRTLSSLWYLSLGIAWMVFGFLGLSAVMLPRPLSVVILLIGVFFVISGGGGLLISAEFADNASFVPFLLMIVGLVWLWRVFLSGRLDPAQPA
jgi:hypothetical protein